MRCFVRSNGFWEPRRLAGSRYALRAGSAGARLEPPDGTARAGPLLARGEGDRAGWFLLAAPGSGVRLNGAPLATGIAALADRDEVDLPDGVRYVVSAERTARMEPFPRGDAPPCPRCTRPIVAGDTAVCCPACGVWLHESEALACFSYGPCAACGAPSALGDGLRWVPEEPA